jgi:uncharacterized protein (TIRG00374 family)
VDEPGPAKRAVVRAAAPGRTIRVAARVTLTLGLTAAVVAVLIRQIGGSALSAAVRGARPGWVVASFALSGLCVLLGAVRWKMVLRAMGHELSLGRILVVLLATWPPGVVMPSRANELLRAVAVREVVPLAAGTGSILAEKLIDLFVLLAFAGVGAAAQALWPWLAVIGLALATQIGLTALLERRRGWLSRLPILRKRPGAVEGLFAAFDALIRSPVRLGSVALV